MSETFQRYIQLRTALGHARWMSMGEESDEEDSILDEMDGLWWAMTNEERRRIEAMDPIPTFEELRAMRRPGTSALVDRPLERSVLDCQGAGHRELEEVA